MADLQRLAGLLEAARARAGMGLGELAARAWCDETTARAVLAGEDVGRAAYMKVMFGLVLRPPDVVAALSEDEREEFAAEFERARRFREAVGNFLAMRADERDGD